MNMLKLLPLLLLALTLVCVLSGCGTVLSFTGETADQTWPHRWELSADGISSDSISEDQRAGDIH